MKWNTRIFKNIDNEVFECGFEGEKWFIEPGEIRYFPTFLAEHFAKHLAEKLMQRALGSRTGKYLNREVFMKETIQTMLGNEISTYREEGKTPFRKEIDDHEKAVMAMLVQQQRNQRATIIEAKKIAEKNVRKTTSKKSG